MSLRRPASALTSLALFAGVLASGCASTPRPSPSALLAGAAAALSSLKTVRMDLAFGSGLSIDELTLYTGSAAVEPPGASEASFLVRRGGILTNLDVVGTAGRRFDRVPPAAFEAMPQGDSSEILDPAALLDPGLGLPGLLPRGSRPTYLGTAAVGGAATEAASAEYASGQLQPLIRAQPAGAGTLAVWVARSDHRPRLLVFSGALRDAGRRFRVEVRLHDFDQPLHVAAPPA